MCVVRQQQQQQRHKREIAEAEKKRIKPAAVQRRNCCGVCTIDWQVCDNTRRKGNAKTKTVENWCRSSGGSDQEFSCLFHFAPSFRSITRGNIDLPFSASVISTSVTGSTLSQPHSSSRQPLFQLGLLPLLDPFLRRTPPNPFLAWSQSIRDTLVDTRRSSAECAHLNVLVTKFDQWIGHPCNDHGYAVDSK